MNLKNIVFKFGIAAAFSLAVNGVLAQDIHFTQFEASPLTINPAFTGMFDGNVRACAIYRNQWSSVTVPYETIGASIDKAIVQSNAGYLAAGLQLFNDKAGDGNLSNFTGLISLAYHLTSESSRNSDHSSDLSVGLQGGYAQKSIDLSKLYFGDEFVNGTFAPGTTAEYHLGIGNSVSYYLVNAGIAYSKSFSSNFNLTAGIGVNNINQPVDAIEKKQSSENLLDMRYTGVFGFNLKAGPRLTLRPAVLYQYQATASELIAGNEFHVVLSSQESLAGSDANSNIYSRVSTSCFLGVWYRTGDALMITAGIEYKGVRVGVGYDYNMSTLNSASNGNGGYEIAIRYALPSAGNMEFKRRVPCARF